LFVAIRSVNVIGKPFPTYPANLCPLRTNHTKSRRYFIDVIVSPVAAQIKPIREPNEKKSY